MRNFAESFRLGFPGESFTETDLSTVLQSKSLANIYAGISRSLKNSEFIKLKRGVYVFGKDLRRGSLSKLDIANRLYEPSYVSFEMALSYHGWIPETVHTVTSASRRRSKKSFNTSLGLFTYEHIPEEAFLLGVAQEREALIAHPLKALFDYVYQRRKAYQYLEEIEDDLRIEKSLLLEAYERVEHASVETLARAYRKARTDQLFKALARKKL